MKRLACAASALILLLLSCGCKISPSINVAASVNNRVITYAELDKTFQSEFTGTSEGSTEDQVMVQKLEVLRNLIDSEIAVSVLQSLPLPPAFGGANWPGGIGAILANGARQLSISR